MTQEEALKAYQEMFPEKAEHLEAERTRSIGRRNQSEFTLWDWSGLRLGMVKSERSWEHALAMAKSGDENIWPEDQSPVEDEITA